MRNPLLWHFSFGGPDAERLVQGRERIFLDRFWNEFAADPSKIDEATRAHYAALYAQPGAMRAGFAQFAAFAKDAEDNKVSQRIKLTMPVLAVGGEKSFGSVMGVIMRNVASDVREAIVPGAGHWLMEENAPVTVALVRDFLGSQQAGAGERRTSPNEFEFSGGPGAGTGTSAVAGIRTVVLKGDPDRAGLYTIMLHVPANTRIAAHDHPDDRVATVISGTWYIGYGERFNATDLKALPPGSFYTEPPDRVHFAETRDRTGHRSDHWFWPISDRVCRSGLRSAAAATALAARDRPESPWRCHLGSCVTHRIHRSLRDHDVVLALSGDLDQDHATELRALLATEDTKNVVLDLADVTLVDRDAVQFLAGAEAEGAVLVNCPEYVRIWIDAEQRGT